MKKRANFLRGLVIGSTLIIGLWIVGEIVPAQWQTSPTSPYDWTLWPLLRVVWEPFSKKRSHWWHWHTYKDQIPASVVVKGRPKATDRSNIWENFYQTNFGWHDVVVLRPVDYDGLWQIGFSERHNNGQFAQYCAVIVERQREIAALIGPYDTTFFAISPEGTSIKLEITQVTTKSELAEDIPLF